MLDTGQCLDFYKLKDTKCKKRVFDVPCKMQIPVECYSEDFFFQPVEFSAEQAPQALWHIDGNHKLIR